MRGLESGALGFEERYSGRTTRVLELMGVLQFFLVLETAVDNLVLLTSLSICAIATVAYWVTPVRDELGQIVIQLDLEEVPRLSYVNTRGTMRQRLVIESVKVMPRTPLRRPWLRMQKFVPGTSASMEVTFRHHPFRLQLGYHSRDEMQGFLSNLKGVDIQTKLYPHVERS